MDVLNLSLPLFGLILIGYFCAKISSLDESALGWMNFFIIYVALPALFFQLIRKAPLESLINYRFVLASTGATVVLFICGFVLGKVILKRPGATATIQAVAASYANIGYMGPAITISALGKAALIPSVIIFCFDNAFLFVVVPIMMALSSNRKHSTLLSICLKAFLKVITHPFIVATLLGILASVFTLELPTAIETILTMLSNTAAPAALFTMGVVIGKRKAIISGVGIPLIIVLKLVAHPVCVYFLIKLLGPFDPVWEKTAVLMACLPPALNIYVMATDYKTYVREASSIVLIGTVFALGSVTYVLYLINNNLF